METYSVYAKVNAKGCLFALQSSAHLKDASGWVKIDEGLGMRYSSAQSLYLSKPLVDEYGAYRYKLTDGVVCERSEAERMADRQEESTAPAGLEDRLKTVETDVAQLTETVDMILSGVTDDE